jgi:hypothetical protein
MTRFGLAAAALLAMVPLACGPARATSHAPASAPQAVVVEALGGFGSETGGWFHLDQGRYQVTWKPDSGGDLSGVVLVRRALVDSTTVTSADQTEVVVFMNHPGEQSVPLEAGDYFINVLMGSSSGWTVDITKIGVTA